MMRAIRVISLTAVTVLLLSCLLLPGWAAETSTSVYCLAQEDFAADVTGIFVLSVPEQEIGTVCSGDRVIRAGDVLTADSLSELTLNTCGMTDAVACLTYLPLYVGTVGSETTLRVNIRSGKAGIPVAKDLELETYRNIPNDGILKASDEGGGSLVFRLETEPKLGTAELEANGSFIYTPQKNKVGEDSFTYTVTDSDGNTSAPATVRITILKPKADATYEDMTGDPGAFEAMWLREHEIFSGSMIGSHSCFCPEQTVTRAQFLTQAMRLMELEPVEESASGFVDEAEAAAWMRPYLASAMRSGIVRGVATDEGLKFLPNRPVTYAEAAVILQNLLRLPMTDVQQVSADGGDADVPAWAAGAVAVLADYHLPTFGTDANEQLTRMDCAELFYQASRLK